jgi:hypothetical protein
MIQNDDRSFDPVTEPGDPAAARAVAALDRAYTATPPTHLRAAMDRAVHTALATPRASTAPVPRRWARLPAAPRRRLAALATVLLLALSGAAGVLRLGGLAGPTPASAQTILRRAATAGMAPNQVTHFVYQITSSTGFADTRQFWVQADANGRPERVAFDGTGPLSVGIVRQLAAAYDFGPSSSGSRMVGQQTLDGHTVDVVQNPAGAITYFDAQTYIVQGADWTMKEGPLAGSSWHSRLLQYGTVPASAVPAVSWHTHGAPPASGATPPRSP